MSSRQLLGALLLVWAFVLIVTFGRGGWSPLAIAAWWLALGFGVIGAVMVAFEEIDDE